MKYSSVIDGIPNGFTPFFHTIGIRPTYLLSPEIIVSQQCAEVLSNLSDCELGVHLHGEFIEPEASSDANATDIPPCGYLPAVERAKLRFNRPFRPDLWLFPNQFSRRAIWYQPLYIELFRGIRVYDR